MVLPAGPVAARCFRSGGVIRGGGRIGLALLAVVALVGCSTGDDRGGDTGDESPSSLAAQLEETGLVLYVPDLAGHLPSGFVDGPEPGVRDMDPESSEGSPVTEARETARPTRVEVVGDEVVFTYTRGSVYAYRLQQMAAPDGPLCRAVEQSAGSSCAEEGGVMRSTMEEMATVAVVRGDTLLVLHDIVVEPDPDMLAAAVGALREAPAASPDDLAELDS